MRQALKEWQSSKTEEIVSWFTWCMIFEKRKTRSSDFNRSRTGGSDSCRGEESVSKRVNSASQRKKERELDEDHRFAGSSVG